MPDGRRTLSRKSALGSVADGRECRNAASSHRAATSYPVAISAAMPGVKKAVTGLIQPLHIILVDGEPLEVAIESREGEPNQF